MGGKDEDVCWCSFCSCALLISGIVMLPLGLVREAEHGRSIAADFPKMSNDMATNGYCTVVGLWTRSVERHQSCGKSCVRKVCYDDYVAEFGWVGGPTNNGTEGMVEFGGMSTVTSKVDMSQVDMTRIDVRVNTGCKGGCDRYGGWLLNGTVADRSSFTSVALSQGWGVERCRHCAPCGDDDPTDDNNHGADQTHAPPWGFPEHPVPEATGIVVGDDVLCRIPAEGAASVPDTYDCPDDKFNSLCARLADLPDIELSGATKGAQALITWGSICLSIGMVPVLFIGLVLLLNFKKPRHDKKERVRHVVRQMSGKNMAGNIRRVSRGASSPSLSLAGPGAPPAVATVEGVALTDASTAGMTTTSGVVVTGAPVIPDRRPSM